MKLLLTLSLTLFTSISFAKGSCALFVEQKASPLKNHNLIGKEDLSKNPSLLRFLVKEIRSLRTARDFQQLPWADLGELTLLGSSQGNGNDGVYKGYFNSTHIAVKVLNENTRADETGMIREAKVLMELNKLNRGVEFIGLTRTPSGQLALVTEFVDGSSVSLHKDSHREAGEKGTVTRETLSDIEKTAAALNTLGYQYTIDMQFMISNSGEALLVDPEYFYLNRPIVMPLDTSHPTAPFESASLIYRGLFPYISNSKEEPRQPTPQLIIL